MSLRSGTGDRLDQAAYTELSKSFQGELIGPDHPGYDEHRRVWNGSIDRRPSLIARCASTADVVSAVRFGRRSGLPIAVRGGGHSFPGLSVCDDGLVIDLRPMASIRVDPDTRRVHAGAGALLGELDQQTQPFGLAVPAGIVTHTGLAGLTLGGGIGWLMRKHGLTVDNLLSAEVVTAAGEVATASGSENPDLFWGLRGGGGNFGIVTEFELQAREIGTDVYAGGVFWPIDQARSFLEFYRDWIRDVPDEVMTVVLTRRAPGLPVVPPDWVGRHVIGLVACYVGPVDVGEAVLRPLKAFGAPVFDFLQPRSFLSLQGLLDPSFKPGWWYYVRSCDVADLDDGVIDVIAEYGSRIGSPISSIALWQMGGAVARVDADATAFNGRDAGFTFNINGNAQTSDGFEEERQWARDYWTTLAPYHTSVYVNFLMEEGETRVRDAYGAAKYERLKALKRTYDPDNLFRLNQNIQP